MSRTTARLALAALTTLAAGSAAQAQSLPFYNPSGCPDAQLAANLSNAHARYQDAQDVLGARTGFVMTVQRMDAATMRRQSTRVLQQIDADREELRTGPNPAVQARLVDNQKRHELLTEAMARALADEKVDTNRHSYIKQVRAAQADVDRLRDAYLKAAAACGYGQQRGAATPVRTPRAPGVGGPPVIYGTPAVGTPIAGLQTTPAAPPPPPPPPIVIAQAQPQPQPQPQSTGRSAGGRIKFKPMSQEDSQKMASQFSGSGVGGQVDLSSWGGTYDMMGWRFNVEAGVTDAVVTGRSPDGATSSRLRWTSCQPPQDVWITCSVEGQSDDPRKSILLRGRVQARRSGDTIAYNYVFDTVATTWKGPPGEVGMAPGETVAFTLQRRR